ncbi:MAG TPA: hypothetical protein VFE82_03600 [Ramlibacter sp.]|jgi:hypothetical protein|uniref:hypothetical protein n=1 Tax=Ramlibacter sp. TaxID=1917967 RepID=UPI002D45A52F|nr:hypothetical protein [Ramlibacter sp.]HZY17537.1 hypothetical protein [Ramlibacter sp.]
MAETEPLMIDCGPHGKRVSAVVCQHLIGPSARPVGFVENCDDPHDLQAWCHACEETFQREEGMSEAFRAFNGMTLVCVVCYADAKARHSLQGH